MDEQTPILRNQLTIFRSGIDDCAGVAH